MFKTIKSISQKNLSEREIAILESIKNLTPDEFMNLMQRAQTEIRNNLNFIQRETGDRILIWDISRLIDMDTDDYYDFSYGDQHVLVTEPSYIAKVGERYKSTVFGTTFTLDLVIYSPTLKKHFRTSSDFVKTYIV